MYNVCIISKNVSDHYLMVLNTQSYMWDGLDGMVGYLLGSTLRAPYGANKFFTKEGRGVGHHFMKKFTILFYMGQFL